MYKKWTKRLFGLFLTATLLLSSSVTALATPSDTDNKPATGGIQLSAEPLSEEYKDYISSGGKGPVISSLNLDYLGESYAQQRRMKRSKSPLPAKYDLRKQGLISPVENQNPYGTCWTFAALGSAESNLIQQFPHISFSNLHLAWFSNFGKEEEEFAWLKYGGETPDPFEGGGNDPQAVGTLAAWKGVVPSSLVPYSTTVVDEKVRHDSDYHLQDAYYLTNSNYTYPDDTHTTPDTTTIKQILMSDGAVTLTYTAGDEATYFNPETAAMYNDTAAPTNHAVLIAGWDDNYPKENFKKGHQPEHNGAWLIRNSWGTSWGDDGYFWLSYEDKTIKYGCFYNMETNDNYTRNYQHDTLGWSFSVGLVDSEGSPAANNSAYVSNVFTAEAKEQVEAVSFYTTDAGTQYELSIYTGLTDAKNPVSGTLASTSVQSGKEPYAGYHTVELSNPVPIAEGEKFSVVVKLTNPNYQSPIPIEFCPMPIEKEVPEFMGDGGESYLSIDGKEWSDATGVFEEDKDAGVKFYVTNVCVKAFTNPVSTVSFSEMEGPVASGTELKLTSAGSQEIYYTTDGTDPISNGTLYTDVNKLTLDTLPVTVKAVAKTGGNFGTVKSKKYTQAKSELVTLLLENEGSNTHFNLAAGETAFQAHVTTKTEKTRIQPQGADTITVNDAPVTSAAWSQEITLPIGATTTIKVLSEMPGKKTPTTYTIDVYRSALTYDYRAETVSYDESTYTLTDKEGQTIHSGDVITPHISENSETELTLTENATGISHVEYVPPRQVAAASPIDFVGERTVMMYEKSNEVATKPDMSDAVKCEGNYIPLTPGQNVYIRKYATDTAFESKVATIKVPGRPAMPEDPGFDYRTMMTKTAIPETMGYWFQKDESDFKRGTGEPIALSPGTTLHLVTLPTSTSFSSNIRKIPVEVPYSELASVEITFKNSDNNILKDLSYIKYYDKEGSVTETVAAPEGYNIIGEDTYKIDITRDKNGKLVSNPNSLTVTVKKTRIPGEVTSGGGTPGTGDDAPFLPVLLLILSSLGIGTAIILFKRHGRQE